MSRKTTRGRSSLSFDVPNGVLDIEDILKRNPWKQAERFTETDAGLIQTMLDDFNVIVREIKHSPKECPGRRSGPRASSTAQGEDEKKPKEPGRGKNPMPANQRPGKTSARKTGRGASEKTTNTGNKAEKHVDHFPGRQRSAAGSGRRVREKNNDPNDKENVKKTVPRSRKETTRTRKSCEPMAIGNDRVKIEPNETIGSEGYYSEPKSYESRVSVVHQSDIKIKSEPCDVKHTSTNKLKECVHAQNLRPKETSTPKRSSLKLKYRAESSEGRIVRKRSTSASDTVSVSSSQTNKDLRKTGDRDVPVNISRKARKTRGSEVDEKPRKKPVKPKAEKKQEKSHEAKRNYNSNVKKDCPAESKTIRERTVRLRETQTEKINREVLRHERKAARAMEKFSHHVVQMATKMGYFANDGPRSTYRSDSSEGESSDSHSEYSYRTCFCSCSSSCSCSSCYSCSSSCSCCSGSSELHESFEYTLNSGSESCTP